MKTNLRSLFFIVVLTMFAAMALMLGSCIDEVIKFVKVTDTIFVEGKPVTSFVQTVHYDTVYRELLRVDTVTVEVVVKDTVIIVNTVETIVYDTIIQIKTDSVFIERVVEKIVNHFDTIVVERIITNVDTTYIDRVVEVHDTIYITEYEQRVVYEALEYVFPGRSVYYVPEPLRAIVDEYNQKLLAYGKTGPGGQVIITYIKEEDLPGEFWSSNTFEMAGDQQIIQLYEGLTPEESYAAIFREMSRWQLKKKYTIGDKIMNPLFPNDKLTLADTDTKKKPYLDVLFQ